MNETTNPFSLSMDEIRRRMEALNHVQGEILYLLLQGHKLGDIGRMLEIKWTSVDYNVSQAIEKTGAMNRAQLIAWYSISSWAIEHKAEIVFLRERD